jgi:N-hydroxyarylamine O-acetyltransferase
MDLGAYLERIGFEGKPQVDLDTLGRLHRAHLQAIPYETFDVALGRGASRDPELIFDKLVTRRRGGWCYEMCGLFAWALGEIGFAVTPLAGGVERVTRGDSAVGNHLVLLVDLDRRYLCDVGFGDGLLEPIELVPGVCRQTFLEFRLELLDAGRGDPAWWRLHNHPEGAASSFDFQLDRAEEALLDERCRWLQTSLESSFVQNVVAQRHVQDGLVMLRGKVLKRVTEAGVTRRELGSGTDLVETLAEVFDLHLPEAAGLWPAIEARHLERTA